MSTTSDEAMRLLRECHAMLRQMSAPQSPIQVDLDGPHGDPLVKAKSPRDWIGADMTGKRFSECPAEYLEMVADRLDYFNTKETDAKKRRYNELDAARARGWAGRIRAGHKHPATPQTWGEKSSW